MDAHASDGQKRIRHTQVLNGAKGRPLHDGKMGQKLVGRHEEGDFQQQRYGAFHGVCGLVVVLAVVGLENHHPLVSREGLADVSHPGGELRLHIPGPLLHGIRPLVKGQHQKIHHQAQKHNGKAGISRQLIRKGKDHLKYQLQRPNENGFQNG